MEPNNFVYYLTILAASRVEIPLTIANPSYSASSIEQQVKESKAKYIITSQSLVSVAREAIAALKPGTVEELMIFQRTEEDINRPKDPPLEPIVEEKPKRGRKTKEGSASKKKKNEPRPLFELKYEMILGAPPRWGKVPDWKPTDDPGLLTFSAPDADNKLTFSQLTYDDIIRMAEELSKKNSVSEADVILSLVDSIAVFLFSLSKGAKLIQNYDPQIELAKFVADQAVTVMFVNSSFPRKDFLKKCKSAGMVKSPTIIVIKKNFNHYTTD